MKGATRRPHGWRGVSGKRHWFIVPGLETISDWDGIICIGPIQTDMGEPTFASRARNLRTIDVDAARQLALSGHPIGRLDDIASV